ncbi:FHA domain-containing protein [Ammonicoccus fulvus]|uniref:FHA domain-containing protein n=1 Tax=Ammonicoccus fulvus TaxID=3138240 RepID=A0ABZ3FPD0_9ACTN
MVPPPVCPSGHTSESTDYCDICGSPMASASAAGGGSAPAPTPAAPKPMGVVCPNCEVMNAPGALFCEACGYDYTTGTMPRPPEPSVLDLDTPLPDAPAGDAAPSVSAVETPAPLPDSGSGTPAPEAGATGSPPASEADPAAVASAAAALDIDAPAPQSQPSAPSAPPAPVSAVAPPAVAAPASTPSASAPGIGPDASGDTFEWVLEIWIDPEWYALQESPDPMPSAGLPDIIPLRKRSLLIGRPSRSRNIHPDIDCEPDTGISRRQAQLSTDGTRWFLEDLGSANGTFVAEASQGMPTDPIPTGRRYELDGDERIYLGAWTRLVLRRATPEELEAYASA